MGAAAQVREQGEYAPLSYAGQIWKVSAWTYGVQGQYEEYLENQALERLQRQSALLNPLEAAQFRRDHLEMLGSRAWSFGTQLCYRSLDARENFAYLLWLCLQVNHPEASLELAKEIVREQYPAAQEAMFTANPTTRKKTASPESSTPTA